MIIIFDVINIFLIKNFNHQKGNDAMTILNNPFTREQKDKIKDLFGKKLLNEIKEMKKSISTTSKESPSIKPSHQRVHSLSQIPSTLLQHDDSKESLSTLFENLLESLQYTPSITEINENNACTLTLISNIVTNAEKLKNKLQLNGIYSHVEASLYFIATTVCTTAFYCGSILVSAFLMSTAASFIAPSIVPFGLIVGGVLGADFAKKLMNDLGITWYSFFSPTHRSAMMSDNIENTIKESLTKNEIPFFSSSSSSA